MAAAGSGAGGYGGDVRIHRRYECRCYTGARPCLAGVLPVASRRAAPQAERPSTSQAPAERGPPPDGGEDSRAMAAGLADR